MELALYAPEAGYYERQTQIGRDGDFYTSVSVGRLFAELLAFQFAEWLQAMVADQKCPIQIVECGAHDGRLASNVLETLRQQHADALSCIEYWLIEPSEVHRQWQKETLSRFGHEVRWFDAWDKLPGRVEGIIFSNELLDAMPVHRLRWNANTHRWQEMKVAWDGAQFCWLAENPGPEVQGHLPVVALELAAVLPDGFLTEVSPAAVHWWKNAAHALSEGKLVAFDYGLTQEEFLLPHRNRGTLRTYFRHHAGDDLLANPGEQDITAHVNFSALQEAGDAAGLKTSVFVSQAKFLTEIAAKVWQSPMAATWNQERVRQFQTLTHPEHLGRPFRVLVQER